MTDKYRTLRHKYPPLLSLSASQIDTIWLKYFSEPRAAELEQILFTKIS